MNIPNNWKGLIDQATKHEAQILANVTNTNQTINGQAIEVKVQ